MPFTFLPLVVVALAATWWVWDIDCILSAPAVVVVAYLGVVAGGHRDRECGGEEGGEGLDGPHLIQRY
jgi:hypothetical protein